MRNIARVTATVASLSLFGLLVTGSAHAASDDADYGEHVVDCAQAMGFTGSHNPGVHHRGKSGWDADHACTMP